jgi:DNA-binding MarR family transcriptional regulator
MRLGVQTQRGDVGPLPGVQSQFPELFRRDRVRWKENFDCYFGERNVTGSHLVDRLIERGLVVRRRSEKDRRTVEIELSAVGERLKNKFTEQKLRSFVPWLVIGVALLWPLATVLLLAARWVDPPTTAVHIERRLQALVHQAPYRKRYNLFLSVRSRPVSNTRSSPRKTGASTSTMASIGTRSN